LFSKRRQEEQADAESKTELPIKFDYSSDGRNSPAAVKEASTSCLADASKTAPTSIRPNQSTISVRTASRLVAGGGEFDFSIYSIARCLAVAGSFSRISRLPVDPAQSMFDAIACKSSPDILLSSPTAVTALLDHQFRVAAKEQSHGSSVIEVSGEANLSQPSSCMPAELVRHCPGTLDGLVAFERENAFRKQKQEHENAEESLKALPKCDSLASRSYTIRMRVSHKQASAITLAFSDKCAIPGRAVWVAVSCLKSSPSQESPKGVASSILASPELPGIRVVGEPRLAASPLSLNEFDGADARATTGPIPASASRHRSNAVSSSMVVAQSVARTPVIPSLRLPSDRVASDPRYQTPPEQVIETPMRLSFSHLPTSNAQTHVTQAVSATLDEVQSSDAGPNADRVDG